MGNIAPTAAQQTNEYLYSIIRELENHEQYPAVHPLTPCMLHGKIFKTIPYYISRSSSESKKVALKILYKYTKALPNDTNQVGLFLLIVKDHPSFFVVLIFYVPLYIFHHRSLMYRHTNKDLLF